MRPHLAPFVALSVLMFNYVVAYSQDQRPNFVIIVADDMGFSDVGAFGGEIRTPNIDRLADSGVRYTNFYVAPTCSPTRAMLMTGIDNHRVGMGTMYEYEAPSHAGVSGYEGVLSTSVPTIAEVLKAAGYHTYMAGKWHLGKEREQLPANRGFEQSFAMLSGSGSYFSLNGPDENTTPNDFSENGEYINSLPKRYYSTTTFTDKIIASIESNKNDGQPFLAYLAHQAPHDPLMVPRKYLRKYEGKFDHGWDSLRTERLNRMVEMGIIDSASELGERFWYVPGFDKLKPLSQVVTARKMEIYASVVEYLDMEIGRLINYLDDQGLGENTYIIFFSDNGPDINDKSATLKNYPSTSAANWMASTYIHGYQNWGRAESFTAYGAPWAQVSATPFYGSKYTTYEGGIRSPLIVVSPNRTDAGQINNEALLQVKDIAPTLIDLAGIATNYTFEMQGKSWASMIRNESVSPRSADDYIAIELWNGKALRKGQWKLVSFPKPIGTGDWQLFNIVNDPGERNDLAVSYPEIVDELRSHWNEFVIENNVVPADRTIWDGMEDKLPPRPPVYAPDFNRGSEVPSEKKNQ